MNEETDDPGDEPVLETSSDIPEEMQSGFVNRSGRFQNEIDEAASDAAEDVMSSGVFDDALDRTLPYNNDHLDKMFSPLAPETYNGKTIPAHPKPWEVRPSFQTVGKLQIYLPAGTSCLYLNANAVSPALSLSVTASTDPNTDGYYEINIDDSTGPLVLYRWFEPVSGANGRWMLGNGLDFAGQWNMGQASALPGGYLFPTIIAIKDSSGVWIPCDNGCMDYVFDPGDAQCAEAQFGGSAIGGVPKSINADRNGSGARMLHNWLAGSQGAAPVGTLVYCYGPDGVGQLMELTSAETGGDWHVSVDDVDAPTVLQQVRGSGKPTPIIGILPL